MGGRYLHRVTRFTTPPLADACRVWNIMTKAPVNLLMRVLVPPFLGAFENDVERRKLSLRPRNCNES